MKTVDRAAQVLSALVPAVLAAILAAPVACAAHDDGVIRVVGAGHAGLFRALDALVAAPLLLLPLGTRALRAGLASAVVTGFAGYVTFALARDVAARVVPVALRRLGLRGEQEAGALVSAVAAVGTLTALVSPAWQAEARAPGGAVTGALLVLLALRSDAAIGALLLGLAASHGPFTLLATAAALAPLARTFERRHALAFVVGLFPLGLGVALALRAPELRLEVPWLAFERERVAIMAFATNDVGRPLLVLGGVGGALALWLREVRVVAVAALLPVLLLLSAPAGDASVLAAVAVTGALAASALGAIALAIARMRIPFATASAALVVMLELVLPVGAIDDTLTRAQAQVSGAADVWTELAFGPAPPASVVLVADGSTARRIASARAAGAMRGDLVVVPTRDVQGRQAERALLAEPKLASLYRDLALGLPPEELSLAQLGAERAIFASFDPSWDRALARHFVPLGLMARFEPEPRGASERRRALEAFEPTRDVLARVAAVKRDPALASATGALLRARAVTMAATGEHDILARALDDLRLFAPNDRVGTLLVRRQLTTKGPIDVRDLRE